MRLAKVSPLVIAEALETALYFDNRLVPPIWEFYCDDTLWLERLDEQGYIYWDTREIERGGQLKRDLANLKGSCMDNKKGLMAFWTPYDGPRPEEPVEVITLCPKALEKFKPEPLRRLRERTYNNHEAHLGDMKIERMAFSLLHELSHSEAILGNDAYRMLDLVAFRDLTD